MNIDDFRRNGHEVVDWIADYFQNIESLKVKPDVEPGDIFCKLPVKAPESSESFEQIMSDFENIIMPGITHWQHPGFMAYFNANNSLPSILAEMLTAALGAQCMIWQTSPAAAELEEAVMNWLRSLTGLPEYFTGVIQDTASTATLCSILTAREKFSDYQINKSGFSGKPAFRVYCSAEAHSSVEKAVKIAGLGSENLVKIPVDENFAMLPEKLEEFILNDLINGYAPLCCVAAIGTTSSTAIDPLRKIGSICKRYSLWLHVDAAHSGTALILPEMRHFIDGIELADTFVFNPHKWMFTNFDCSAYYVKDKGALIRTFEIMPEYLKTGVDSQVNNYRDWGVQLGRRFRALKLWFVMRSFGAEGLREKIRLHIDIAAEIAEEIRRNAAFELLAPVPLNTICFRYHPNGITEDNLNDINAELLKKINENGKIYITHTKLNGKYALRLVFGQTNLERRHARMAWEIINECSKKIDKMIK